MRPMNEIEIELPQIVLDRADAAYVQIRQQAAQEKQLTGKRFPRAAGILLAVVILSVTAVSATAAADDRRYLTAHHLPDHIYHYPFCFFPSFRQLLL